MGGDYSHKSFHHNLWTTLGGATGWSSTSANKELAECNNVDVA